MTEPPNSRSEPSANTVAVAFEPYTPFAAIEELIEQYLGPKSRLQLPPNQRDKFVRFLPWVAVIFLPIHFVAVLFILGMTALAAMLGSVSYVGAVISIGVFVLDIVALPGLFKRTRHGWIFFLYAITLSALGSIVELSPFGILISIVIFWLLFQTKYLYR